MAPWSSAGTSPSATRSPRASATPTPRDPTACAAGPTGSRRSWPAARRTSATPTWPSAGASCTRSSPSSSSPRWPSRPDLVTSYAGANDILRPRVDIDALAAAYDEAVGRLVDSGATVVLFTAFDPGGSAIYRPRARAVRALHRGRPRDRRAARDPARRLLADARVPRLGLLGHRPDAPRSGRPPAHGHAGPRRPRTSRTQLEELPPTPHPELTGRELRAQNLEWARTHAVPVGAPPPHRPVLGRHVSPKRPTLAPIEPASQGRVTSPPSAHPGPTRGCSSVGRARPSQGRCREFESRHPLHGISRFSRRSARLLRRPRARQHQVVLGGAQARLRRRPCATRCSR